MLVLNRLLGMEMDCKGLLSLAIVTLVLGCAGTGEGYRYKLYPGPARPDNELATLEFCKPALTFRVDGMRVEQSDYEVVDLLPGEHEIKWGAEFGVSLLVNPAGRDAVATEVTVELRAGHRYIVCADRTTGPGYRMYLWIEDAATHELVAGRRMP